MPSWAPARRRPPTPHGSGSSDSSAARPVWPDAAPIRAAPGSRAGRSRPRVVGPSAADRPGPRRRVRRSSPAAGNIFTQWVRQMPPRPARPACRSQYSHTSLPGLPRVTRQRGPSFPAETAGRGDPNRLRCSPVSVIRTSTDRAMQINPNDLPSSLPAHRASSSGWHEHLEHEREHEERAPPLHRIRSACLVSVGRTVSLILSESTSVSRRLMWSNLCCSGTVRAELGPATQSSSAITRGWPLVELADVGLGDLGHEQELVGIQT